MKITIYSTTTCPYCKMLKSYLTAKGVQFTEKLIDMDENYLKEQEGISGGFMGVPFTLIEEDNGQKETVLGFDKGKLEKIIQ